MPPEWLTYAQAGEKFGLSPEAIRLRARRFGWRTQPGNDGRTLVIVPEDADVQRRLRPTGVLPSSAPTKRTGAPRQPIGNSNYVGGDKIRFAFVIASPYTSAFIIGVNVGSAPVNHVTTYISSAICAGVSRFTTMITERLEGVP
jgi:hypothetical protein